MNSLKSQNKARGFTAVEMLITIFVTALFIAILYQLFTAINISINSTRQKSMAGELAYSYLRKYAGADGNPSTWFSCSMAAGGSNSNDYTKNVNAPGQTLESGTPTDSGDLPKPVTYSVKALAIYGCSGTNSGTPLKVEATVTYGPYNTTVRHATLVGY